MKIKRLVHGRYKWFEITDDEVDKIVYVKRRKEIEDFLLKYFIDSSVPKDELRDIIEFVIKYQDNIGSEVEWYIDNFHKGIKKGAQK